jgi:magnesium-protoporphyrin O-methyltransferase
MTCAHCRDAATDVFNSKLARRELKRYRRRGPLETTEVLLDAVRAEGVKGRTVLDIGGGVGAIQHELLAAGAERVLNVDASPAYQETVRREAEARGTLQRIEFYAGDFVEVAPALPVADFVTLDRVLCCYPDVRALVGASAGRARLLWGAVFPRETRFMRFGMRVINLVQRLRRSAFRMYNHTRAEVEEELRARGFERRVHRQTMLWQVMVWGKEN